MKNVEKRQLKKAICMTAEEFELVIEEATREYPEVDYGYEGIDYYTDSFNSREIESKLSDYFDINITSIHIDDCDSIGVWIVYIEN